MELLCQLSDLPDGSARGFDPRHAGQDRLFVVRQGAQVFAYADSCPHLDTPMAWRKDAYLNAAGDRIVCAAHGAQFEIESGRCTLGPCIGQSLIAVPLNIRDNGEIYLANENNKETFS